MEDIRGNGRKLGHLGTLTFGDEPIRSDIIHHAPEELSPGTDEQVPIGSVGQIYIGGPQVTRGYLGLPGLTAQHFTSDAFLSAAGVLGGRKDSRIKLWGLRTDVDKIVSAAQSHLGIKACAVVKIEKEKTEASVALVEVDQKLSTVGSMSEFSVKEFVARSVTGYMWRLAVCCCKQSRCLEPLAGN
ncbi:hypothetical protein BBP40_008880 [Aspergillus hancockii]|nr:hypothetical protein BBP40_008880 [Aspergillus hancockii]